MLHRVKRNKKTLLLVIYWHKKQMAPIGALELVLYSLSIAPTPPTPSALVPLSPCLGMRRLKYNYTLLISAIRFHFGI